MYLNNANNTHSTISTMTTQSQSACLDIQQRTENKPLTLKQHRAYFLQRTYANNAELIQAAQLTKTNLRATRSA